MLWFFGGVEIGIISLISGGFYLKQDGSFGWKAKKTVFLRFFQFSAKTTIFYQKRFKDLIFHHQNKLWFKCSKKWSGSSVTMLPWSLCLAQKLKSPKFGQIRCISNCVWNIDKYVGNVLEKRDRSLGWLLLRSAAVLNGQLRCKRGQVRWKLVTILRLCQS